MTRWRIGALSVAVIVGLLLTAGRPVDGFAEKPELKGKFELLKDEPSTHRPGKVKLVEFADFYCPHCHHFDGEAVPMLEKEFGSALEVVMVGFPVIRGKLPTPFDMYEQAKAMGKGNEMKKVLFRTIHRDRISGVLDRMLRESLIKEVGLDPKAFEEGMASGKPAKAFEDGDRKSTRLNSSHVSESRMPSSA